MEAITDLKHILHRGKYITKNNGNVVLAGYFFLLNLLNRITIKLHLIEKTSSTITSIPFAISTIFTSNKANIFYCFNCGENAIVKIVHIFVCKYIKTNKSAKYKEINNNQNTKNLNLHDLRSIYCSYF